MLCWFLLTVNTLLGGLRQSYFRKWFSLGIFFPPQKEAWKKKKVFNSFLGCFTDFSVMTQLDIAVLLSIEKPEIKVTVSSLILPFLRFVLFWLFCLVGMGNSVMNKLARNSSANFWWFVVGTSNF